MVVNFADDYKIRSNRESGKNETSSFGRYDVMMEPLDKTGKAFIFEFKVIDLDEDEKTLEDTLANAHAVPYRMSARQILRLPGFVFMLFSFWDSCLPNFIQQ